MNKIKAVYNCYSIVGKPNMVAELSDGTYRILIWTPGADKSQDTFRLGGNFLKMGCRVEDLSPLTQADEHFIPIEKIIGKEVEEVQK